MEKNLESCSIEQQELITKHNQAMLERFAQNANELSEGLCEVIGKAADAIKKQEEYVRAVDGRSVERFEHAQKEILFVKDYVKEEIERVTKTLGEVTHEISEPQIIKIIEKVEVRIIERVKVEIDRHSEILKKVEEFWVVIQQFLTELGNKETLLAVLESIATYDKRLDSFEARLVVVEERGGTDICTIYSLIAENNASLAVAIGEHNKTMLRKLNICVDGKFATTSA